MTDRITRSASNNKHGGIKKCPSSSNIKEKKKGTSAMHVFRVAMHMLRKKKDGKKEMESNNKPSPLSLPTNDALSRLVGSVRPLHLQGNVGGMLSPPPPPPLLLPPMSPDWGNGGALVSPRSEASFFSVASPSPSSSSIGGTISRYASVQSLYELGITEEEEMNIVNNNNVINEEVDAYYDGLEGDELIDSKAEMFIAQFYKQMKLNPNPED